MKLILDWKRPIFSSALICKINRIFQSELRLLGFINFIYYEKKNTELFCTAILRISYKITFNQSVQSLFCFAVHAILEDEWYYSMRRFKRSLWAL